jgi:hypothetical protein
LLLQTCDHLLDFSAPESRRNVVFDALDGGVFVLVERVIAFLAVQAAVGIVAKPVRPERD